jgi:HlyD family secretion protein
MGLFLGKFKSMKLWIAIFVVVGLAIFAWIATRPKGLVTANGNLLKKFAVVTRDIENIISLSGTVDANEKATLQFQTSGKLVWVGVKEGDSVSSGQVIASLDQHSLRKNLEKDLKDFSTQRLSLDQFRDDNKNSNIGQPNKYLTDQLTRLAQQDQNSLDKSILNVELDSLSLELANLVSPISGIITHIDQPVAGVNITPATARILVVNPQNLYLLGTVDQQDIAKIKQEARAKIVFDAFPEAIYYGAVSYIAFAPDGGDNNSYSIKVSIPAEAVSQLRLAMGAEITIVTDKKNNVLALPPEAIIDENGRKYVSILKDDKPVKHKITTGLETDDFVEVTGGLQNHDVVVY